MTQYVRAALEILTTQGGPSPEGVQTAAHCRETFLKGQGERHLGWANYETWNVGLWTRNDSRLSIMLENILYSSGRIRGKHVQLFNELFMNGRTPDVPLEQMGRVDWEEIAAQWDEERRELQGWEDSE